MNVLAVNGSLVPGVDNQRLNVTFTLLNNNEPDLNNDVAVVDQTSYNGSNFNITSYVIVRGDGISVTAAAADVIAGRQHQLMPVDDQLVVGDLHSSIDGVQTDEFTVELTVHNLSINNKLTMN